MSATPLSTSSAISRELRVSPSPSLAQRKPAEAAHHRSTLLERALPGAGRLEAGPLNRGARHRLALAEVPLSPALDYALRPAHREPPTRQRRSPGPWPRRSNSGRNSAIAEMRDPVFLMAGAPAAGVDLDAAARRATLVRAVGGEPQVQPLQAPRHAGARPRVLCWSWRSSCCRSPKGTASTPPSVRAGVGFEDGVQITSQTKRKKAAA